MGASKKVFEEINEKIKQNDRISKPKFTREKQYEREQFGEYGK